MTIVQELARVFAPWQSLYSDTKAVSIAVPALHIVAMLIGGGMAVAADRMTLRMAGRREGEREWHLDELAAARSIRRGVISCAMLPAVRWRRLRCWACRGVSPASCQFVSAAHSARWVRRCRMRFRRRTGPRSTRTTK